MTTRFTSNSNQQEPVVLQAQTKPTILGSEGVSQDDYNYIQTTYLLAVLQELRGKPTIVDIQSGFSGLTQYDTLTASVVGKVKSISVFVEGDFGQNVFKSYAEYDGSSGVYWYPKSLYSILYDSFGDDAIFLTGKSVKSVRNADDKMKKVAYKVVKRLTLYKNFQSSFYKIVSKVVPVAISAFALSL
jgi:hypothetical protein